MHKLIGTLLILLASGSLLGAATPKEAAAPGQDTPPQKYALRSARQPGMIDRVTASMEVGGEVKYVEKEKVQRAKMSVVAKLVYDERTLEVPSASGGSRRSVRHYDQAEAVIKVGEDGVKPTLDDRHRLIGVRIDDPTSTLFCPHEPLSREELDLLDSLGDSLVLDGLLPERPVAQGESWSHTKPLICALLGFDGASTCDVRSTLSEINDVSALIDMHGKVEGAVAGVTARVEMKAKYRFNRKTSRIDWFGLAVREDRDIGHVAQGLDVIARLKMQIEPRNDCPALADDAIVELELEPTDTATQLSCRSPADNWQLAHDRRWFLINNQRDLTILRLIDQGELVAQCNLAPLPAVEPGKQATLKQFQSDIKEALGERFGRFLAASQRADQRDYRVLRVVVEGKVSELPIQWHYYLLADQHGRQATFTFTVEKGLVERLAKSDGELVESFEFLDQSKQLAKASDQ